MIVSHRHKYIFVGFPQAASTTITLELIEHYDGQPLLTKHANIPVLRKMKPELSLDDYYVFGVFRDPVEMVFTTYNKMQTNLHSVFTEPRYFHENGGHVSKKERKLFARMHREGWSFERFVRHAYRFQPYDNDFSLSYAYLDGVIRYRNINDDFAACLNAIGISPVQDLPVFNRTPKVSEMPELGERTLMRVFGPFLQRYAQFSGRELPRPVSRMNMLWFKAFSRIRSMKRMRFERRRERRAWRRGVSE